MFVSRRSFLSMPLALGAGWVSWPGEPHLFAADHVLGTSLTLTTWTSSRAVADRAVAVAMREIARLDGLLSTYRPDSEISRLGAGALKGSPERADLFSLYDQWAERTGGAVSRTVAGRLDVNALGKAFVVDRVAAHVAATVRGLDGFILDIGGDIVIVDRLADIGVADPTRWYDNDLPLTTVRLHGGAVATSGGYARVGHLVEPGTGEPAAGASAATAIARDCVTANALTTALCVLPAAAGARLVAMTTGAEALTMSSDGVVHRSANFTLYEPLTFAVAPVSQSSHWPDGFELSLRLTLKNVAGGGGPGGRGGFLGRGGRGRGGARPPYVAIWVEDASGRPIRTVTVWGNERRWLNELPDWMRVVRSQPALLGVTRATRPAGEYRVAWNGLDDNGEAVPTGTYTIQIEINREHGSYARQSAEIVCGDAPAMVSLSETTESGAIEIVYGPRPGA